MILIESLRDTDSDSGESWWAGGIDCLAGTYLLIEYLVAGGARKSNFRLAGIKGPDKGGERLFTDQENGLCVGSRLTSIGLTKAFLDLCQEAEPFDRILKGGSIRKSLNNLKDLLFHCLSGHDKHLM